MGSKSSKTPTGKEEEKKYEGKVLDLKNPTVSFVTYQSNETFRKFQELKRSALQGFTKEWAAKNGSVTCPNSSNFEPQLRNNAFRLDLNFTSEEKRKQYQADLISNSDIGRLCRLDTTSISGSTTALKVILQFEDSESSNSLLVSIALVVALIAVLYSILVAINRERYVWIQELFQLAVFYLISPVLWLCDKVF
jgi:hypothetical protein